MLILALMAAPAVAQADPVPEYYNVPSGFNAGTGIATAPDGSVWFAANPVGSPNPSIGRLIPSHGAPGTDAGMSIFQTPKLSASCCANATRGVAFDGENNRVWFVQNDGIVGWGDPAQLVPNTANGMKATLLSTMTTSGLYSPSLLDVTIAKGGLAWFTENSSYNVSPYPGGRIASINAALGVTESENLALQGGLTTLNPLRYDAKPAGITTDADGNPWFAESDPGNPGYRIAKGVGSGYQEYLIQPCGPGSPCSGSFTGTGPTDVAVAQDGSVWFTNQLKNEVGRLDPFNNTFTNYSLPGIDPGLAGGQARAITAAPDGTLWVAEYGGISTPNANAIIRIVPTPPSATATVYHLGKGKYPFAVAPDSLGNVWFSTGTDNPAPGQVGRLGGVVGAPVPPPSGGGTAVTPPPGKTILPPASVGTAKIGNPRTEGPDLKVDQICVGPPADPCVLIYILSAREYVNGFPNTRKSSASAAGKKKGKGKAKAKPKPVIYGKKTVTLHGGDKRTVTISLNKAGKKLLKKKGKVTLYFTATQKGADGKPATRVKAKKVTFKQPKPKK